MRNLIVLLLLCSGCVNTESKNNRINDFINTLENSRNEEVIVVAHRGDWRHAPENSLQAIQNAIEMGVDMVEIDVRMTKDSILVLMHDKALDRTTNGKGLITDWTLDSVKILYLRNGLGRVTRHKIPTLEEAMLTAKGKIMVNLDKCYDNFAEAYKVLEKTGTVDHVIMKGKYPVEKVRSDFGKYLDKVFFMPIVSLDEPNAAKIISDYQKEINSVAFEFVFKMDTSKIIDNFHLIKDKGSRVWINSLWASLNGGHDDNRAIDDIQGSYGWIVGKGTNMIQTDRPVLLMNYLESKKLR